MNRSTSNDSLSVTMSCTNLLNKKKRASAFFDQQGNTKAVGVACRIVSADETKNWMSKDNGRLRDSCPRAFSNNRRNKTPPWNVANHRAAQRAVPLTAYYLHIQQRSLQLFGQYHATLQTPWLPHRAVHNKGSCYGHARAFVLFSAATVHFVLYCKTDTAQYTSTSTRSSRAAVASCPIHMYDKTQGCDSP